ncbi:MinD/ParA family ATP-binding protein [Actinomadura fibrosa]|uniref:MinD/ParA family protein n=1 Tax=Actinomadura fibrosa TaxID=111802 RepID=A0ABW2XT57_9ACTN|nr:AAA family ATPase [Actinomadura fibrosa]
MGTVVAVHSYRGGTGKSSTAASLALLAAAGGRRAALVDTDLQAPCAHALFGMDESAAHRSLTDYLVGRCEIEDAAAPVAGSAPGALYLVPARGGPDENNELMTHGYDVGLLREGFDRLMDRLRLDLLVLDTRTGMSNETISALAGADLALAITRADYMDCGVRDAVALASRFARSRRAVAVNMLPAGTPPGPVRREAEAAFGAPVVSVIPYCPDIAALGGGGLLVREDPGHRSTAGYRRIAEAVGTGGITEAAGTGGIAEPAGTGGGR